MSSGTLKLLFTYHKKLRIIYINRISWQKLFEHYKQFIYLHVNCRLTTLLFINFYDCNKSNITVLETVDFLLFTPLRMMKFAPVLSYYFAYFLGLFIPDRRRGSAPETAGSSFPGLSLVSSSRNLTPLSYCCSVPTRRRVWSASTNLSSTRLLTLQMWYNSYESKSVTEN